MQSAAAASAVKTVLPMASYFPKHFGWKATIIGAAYLQSKGTLTLIQGPSMYPTLNTDQQSKIPDLVWSKSDFDPKDLRVGDIVIFDSPLKQDYHYCKRIAALDDTFVYSRESPVPVYVPPGHFWALGDNPRNSHDSDQFGPVSQSLIKGVLTLRVYPWSTEAVKRKVVSREVKYQDPLVLLQQQFDSYSLAQRRQEDETLLTQPVNFINNLVFGADVKQQGDGSVEDDGQSSGRNSHIDPQNAGLSADDIMFNQYQRREAEKHLELLLNENKQQTRNDVQAQHNAQREQFLRSAGKWKDLEDDEGHLGRYQPHQKGQSGQHLPQSDQDGQNTQSINNDPNNHNGAALYNPFEARYGPIK